LANVGFFQNRGYYQFTNGYTTEFGFNDGGGSGLASLLLSLRQSNKGKQAFLKWIFAPGHICIRRG